MKPSRDQVDKLYHFLKSKHGSRLEQLESKAKAFAHYLRGLSNFKIIDAQLPAEHRHVGRVIIDGVLQVGKNYERQVRPAVESILRFPQAATTSGFIRLLSERELKDLINFKTEGIKSDLLEVARFFADKGIETFEDLYAWLESEENRDNLLTERSGLTGKVFRIADKTADYFRVLVRHWDAVAIDRGIRGLLYKAGVISRYSKKYEYKEMRAIVQLTAVSHLDCRPVDLDASIYEYYVANKSGKKPKTTSLAHSQSGNSKYCIECGERIPQRAKYCPKCGAYQL